MQLEVEEDKLLIFMPPSQHILLNLKPMEKTTSPEQVLHQHLHYNVRSQYQTRPHIPELLHQ
jgi:hypothetical protein